MFTQYQKLSCLVIGISALFCAGCGTTGKFVYPANMRKLTTINSQSTTKYKVAVMPFNDYRGDENNSGTLFLYLVPGMPYGHVNYERPGAANLFLTIATFDFEPSEDLAKATALSLRRSNLFEDAYFSYGGQRYIADFVWTGDIISTKYEGTMYSYGHSFIGPVFYLFGLPIGSSACKLSIKFKLKNRNNKIVWEYTYDKSDKITQGMYYRLGHDARSYAKLMQEAMNESILDLAKKIHEKPNFGK
jgi:hypothetical protein